jgi:hypothetical protein
VAWFKKNIAWILQQVCKISKDFILYFKNIKNLFLVKIIYYSLVINIKIKNFKKINIQNINRNNNFFSFANT